MDFELRKKRSSTSIVVKAEDRRRRVPPGSYGWNWITAVKDSMSLPAALVHAA
jgi:hypothetical protein